MALVILGSTSDIDLFALWQRQTDIDFVEAAGAVVAARRLEDHPAGRNSPKTLLELGDVISDGAPDIWACVHALKINLDWCFHGFLPITDRQHGRSVGGFSY